MHCPACGVEVVQQAVFCHQCGKRLDFNSQQFPPHQGEENAPAAESIPTNTQAAGLAEAFQQSIAARQTPDQEPELNLWQGGFSPKAMIGAWVLSGLVTLLLLALGIYFPYKYVWIGVVVVILVLWNYQAIKLLFRRWNVRYTLTTQRFIHETGILRRVTDRIEVIDMDDITVDQKVLERLVGVGTIRVTSSDTTHPELIMPGIENVKQVADLIDDTRRKERRRRGLHIESI